MSIKYYIYKLVCDNVRDFLYINFTKNPTQKKRYYKDNTYLTYKVHKNEVLYQTIHENGGWDNWRFIIIDEVTCTKYQITPIYPFSKYTPLIGFSHHQPLFIC